MPRKNIIRKRFPITDTIYNSYLVSLLINKVLKSGKKTIARKIVYQAFEIIKKKTNEYPLLIFEKAIKNASPSAEIKRKRIGGSAYQIPIPINQFKSTTLALRCIVKHANQRIERGLSIKLANEIIAASNKAGNSFKEKENNQKIVKANKAFAHLNY